MPRGEPAAPEDRPRLARERRQRYLERHPEKKAELLLRLKAWGKANPDRLRERQNAWRSRNRDLVNERERPKNAARAWAIRLEMVAAYGPACACCGETEPVFLTLDHVNGGGAAHRRMFVGLTAAAAQKQIVAELRRQGWPNDDGRFRILCWNCQWEVQRPNGCPHRTTATVE